MGDGIAIENGIKAELWPGTDALINAGIKDENYVSLTQKQVILWLKMHLVNSSINRTIVMNF